MMQERLLCSGTNMNTKFIKKMSQVSLTISYPPKIEICITEPPFFS